MPTIDAEHSEPNPAAPARTRRVAVLANAMAGKGKAAELAERAMEQLAAAGHEHVGLDCRRATFPDQLKALDDAGHEVLVAIGGDGTVNAAAHASVKLDTALAIVPAGTMNMVARDLELTEDVDAAIAAIGSAPEIEIDYATVNGRVFVHSVLLGVVPRMALAREGMRQKKSLGDKARAAVRWVREAFEAPQLEVEMISDAGSDHRMTRSLAVSNNPMAPERPFSFKRASLTGGVLAVYASAHAGPFAAMKLMLTLGTGVLATDPETLSAGCRALVVGTKRTAATVSIDGEVFKLTAPLDFKIHPRGLRVVATRSEGAGA